MIRESYFIHVEGLWDEVSHRIQGWQELDSTLLNKKPAEDKWSALECLNHLSQTYKTYLPNLKKAIDESSNQDFKKYKPGLLGNMMVNSVGLKDNGKAKMPMKTFSFFEPEVESKMVKEKVFDEFMKLHSEFRTCIEKSKNKNINKVKVKSALGSWFKLRLGVCFLFLLNHELRHLAQGERAMHIN